MEKRRVNKKMSEVEAAIKTVTVSLWSANAKAEVLLRSCFGRGITEKSLLNDLSEIKFNLQTLIDFVERKP